MILVLPTILFPMTRILKRIFSCLELLSKLVAGTQLLRLLLSPASTNVSVMLAFCKYLKKLTRNIISILSSIRSMALNQCSAKWVPVSRLPFCYYHSSDPAFQVTSLIKQ